MVAKMNSSDLLPKNATKQEKAIIDAITPELPVQIRDIWNPWTCPERFLPYLAQSFSVDRWDVNWTTDEKRAAIDAAFFVHKHKGTIAAIRRVVEPFGFLIKVVEWFKTVPKGTPYTFQLVISVSEKGIDDDIYNQMVTLIEDAKPLTRHMTGLDIYADSEGVMYYGLGMYCGDTTIVYPYEPGPVTVTGQLYSAGRDHTIDSVSVYPNE